MAAFFAPRRAGVALLACGLGAASAEEKALSWSRLAPLPDAEGFAGMYAGLSGGTLIAAGGTQFANGIPWWDGGKKIWSDAIYILGPNATMWHTAPEKLPRLLGDGVSVSHGGRLVCIGGGDEARAYADVFGLALREGRIIQRALPALPEPAFKMGGGLLGDVIYVIGGRSGPTSISASRSLWSLDLSRPEPGQWTILPDCPGPGRMMPIVVTASGVLYVFGGIEIRADKAGRPQNVAPYLRDAWRYVPGPRGAAGKWEKLADLPQPLAGSPSPGWLRDSNTILIFGGVDGAIEAITDRSSIRALPAQILAYHVKENRWTREGEMPAAEVRVNAPAVRWRNGYAIISGEHLPARRMNACTVVTLSASP